MMENNMIPANNEVIVLPAETAPIAKPVHRNTAVPSDMMAENLFKVATDMVKEGAANAKDNRIIRKKIVDSEIDTTSTNMGVLKAEYERVSKKLEGDLQPKERTRLEERAEILSDRIHATAQAHQEDMRQNTPPKQKGIPAWKWVIGLCVTCLVGFSGGRYYQSRL